MQDVALITGAISWIGRQLAIIHAKNGWNLVLIARRKSILQELQKDLEKQYKVNVTILAKDLLKPNAAQEVYDFVKQEKLDIEYLVNNAWFGGIGKFHEREWQNDKDMITLNITVLTELTRLFLPDFIERGSGRILQVSSTASFLPGPMQAVYYATKAYVQSFSNALSGELLDSNITVTNLMPWATATEFGKISGMDKTSLFNTTASANSVAQDWYNAMMDGKIDVISWLSFIQKTMMYLLPFIPKKIILKQVYDMQQQTKK